MLISILVKSGKGTNDSGTFLGVTTSVCFSVGGRLSLDIKSSQYFFSLLKLVINIAVDVLAMFDSLLYCWP